MHVMNPRTLSLVTTAFALVLASRSALAQDGAPPPQWVGAGHYEISGLDLTPGGAQLVTCCSIDETIKVWNTADGSFVRTLTGPIGGVQDVALSPDGTRLVSGGEVVFGGNVSAMLIWDLASGTITQQLSPADNLIFAVDWSPVDDLVAAGDQANVIHLWNPTTGALVGTLSVAGFAGVFDLAFSADGTRIVAGYADNKVRIWDVATGALLQTLSGHQSFVDSVAFSPDGARVASGSWDDDIRTWNASTGALEHVLQGHSNIVRDLAFSPDGATLASGSWDDTVKLWDAASGALLNTFTFADPDSINALRWTDDGARLATGGIGSGGFMLDATNGTVLALIGHHRGNLHVVTLSGDQSRLISGSGDFDARVWDANTGADLLTFSGHDDVVNAVDVTGDGTLAVSGSGSPPPDTRDFSVRIWDTVTGAELFNLFGHVDGTTGVELANDEKTVFTGGRDARIKQWDVATGALLQTYDSGTGPVTEMELSPDGTRLAIVGNSSRIVDAATGTLQVSLVVPGGNILSSLNWSADGQRLLVGVSNYGDNLLLYDANTGALLRTFSGDPDGFVQGAALSPDGHTATCGSGYSRTIRTFSVDDGTPLKVWDQETGWGPFPLLPLAYAADGRLAYGRADATVVMSNCPGHITTYGTGGPGSGGFVPALALSGCATAGGAITLSIDQALGGSSGFLLFGLGRGSIPFKGSTLLVDPLVPPLVPVVLGGAGPGNGSLALSGVLSSTMPDIVFTLQAWILDAGGVDGFATTNGVEVSVE
jgi:WD40 repeat protein